MSYILCVQQMSNQSQLQVAALYVVLNLISGDDDGTLMFHAEPFFSAFFPSTIVHFLGKRRHTLWYTSWQRLSLTSFNYFHFGEQTFLDFSAFGPVAKEEGDNNFINTEA